MSKVTFDVRSQSITLKDSDLIASGNVNTTTAIFECDGNWDSYTKMAIFYQNENDVRQVLVSDNNTCLIPWESLENFGELNVGLVGTLDDKVLATNIIKISVVKGILKSGKPSEPGEEIWQQIINQYQEIKDLAKKMNDNFTQYKNDLKKDYDTTKSNLNSDYSTTKSNLSKDYQDFKSQLIAGTDAFKQEQQSNYDSFIATQKSNYDSFTKTQSSNYTNFTNTINGDFNDLKTYVGQNQGSARNLIKLSTLDWYVKSKKINVDIMTGTVSGNLSWYMYVDVYFKSNTTYTFSVDDITNSSEALSDMIRIKIFDSEITLQVKDVGNLAADNSLTFTTSQSGWDTIYKVLIYVTQDNTAVDFVFKGLSLHEGALPTPWTPAFEDLTPEIIVTKEFKALNGTSNGTPNTSNLLIMNYPNYQVMTINAWLNGLNLNTAWQRKDVLSLPLKYFRFNGYHLYGRTPSWVIDANKSMDLSFNRETGIISVSPRQNVPIESASVEFTLILTDVETVTG